MNGSGLEPRAPGGRRLRRLPARFSGPVYTIWSAGWITAFALGHSEIGIPMLFATGALPAVVETRGRRGRRTRHWGRPDLDGAETPDPPAVEQPAAPPGAAASAPAAASAERRLAATVVRAESSGIDPDALALVREVAGLLRPMLAEVRRGDADPGVRHDVEAIAAEHLPATLDAYLALPADFAREHRGPDGRTAADEFRAQLTLLVEGCAQLRDALRTVDVARQQQLGRFLAAKFGRSDLDL